MLVRTAKRMTSNPQWELWPSTIRSCLRPCATTSVSGMKTFSNHSWKISPSVQPFGDEVRLEIVINQHIIHALWFGLTARHTGLT